jgi:UV DNA damage endonuclease
VNTFDWQKTFQAEFESIGSYVRHNHLRISMHPDQFTLINSPDIKIFEQSKKELRYHSQMLDLMKLDATAKIQIHVGGAYGDKAKSIQKFVERYAQLEEPIKDRLVVENDERLYTVADCLEISAQTGIPVVFDSFHHKLNHGQNSEKDFGLSNKTWRQTDGVPMVDYSSQKQGGARGQHAQTLDEADFKLFLIQTQPFNFDVMLEIKDKETSAAKALKIALDDPRVK